MDALEAPKKPRLVSWITQRTTISGFLLLLLGAVGIYISVIDAGTATLMVTLGLTGLVPEDMPIARKAISIIAPVLVQQIGKHSATSQSSSPHTDSETYKNPF